MDPDTREPEDTLVPQAQQLIQKCGSHNTSICEIVIQQDKAVFKAIQEGLDKINEDQAQRVCLPCNIYIPAELTSLLFMRVGRVILYVHMHSVHYKYVILFITHLWLNMVSYFIYALYFHLHAFNL